jgi:hypothetical protein
MENEKGVDGPKPLRKFDFGLILPKLSGLRFNLDREIQRLSDQSVGRGDTDAERCLSLLKILLRFAWNSFEAVLYLAGDVPEDYRRKPNYVLVVPSINRQLLDVLFSLAYMFEDFRARSLAYQRAGWRDLYEEREVFKETFGDDPDWKNHLQLLENMLFDMVPRYKITEEEQKTPTLINYWPHPYKLIKRIDREKIACGAFLKYLEKWLYKDTSAQAHMTFGGVFKIALFLVAKDVGEDAVKVVNDRPMKIYRFEQISRTALSFLAIATEIDTYCRLGNHEVINYISSIFGDYAVEAKEMWEIRYRDRSK